MNSKHQESQKFYQDQRQRVIEIMSQPQLRTTLQSSSYMRQLREQSLRGIQNWEHKLKEYEAERKKKAEEEEKSKNDPNNKGGQRGRYGTNTISANSFMR